MRKIVFTLSFLVVFLLAFSPPSHAQQQRLEVPKPTQAEMKYLQDYAEQRDMQTKLFLQLDDKMYPQARAMAAQKKQAEAAQKQNWLQNVMNPATWFKKPAEQPPPVPTAVPPPQPTTPVQAAAPAEQPKAEESTPSFIVLPPKEEPKANTNKQPEPSKDEGPKPIFGFTR